MKKKRLEKIPRSLKEMIEGIDVHKKDTISPNFNQEAPLDKDRSREREQTRSDISDDIQDGFNRRAKYRKLLQQQIRRTRMFFSRKKKRQPDF